MRAIQKPMGLRSVGTAKCQNYFLNKKHWGGGAKATQVIAPPAPNYTNCLRNQLTQQTYATNSDGENFLNALLPIFDLASAGTNCTVSKQQPHSVQDQKFTTRSSATYFDHSGAIIASPH